MGAPVLIKNTHTATVHLPAVPRDYDRAGDAEKALAPGVTPVDADYWDRISRHPVVKAWLLCKLLVIIPVELAPVVDVDPNTPPHEPSTQPDGTPTVGPGGVGGSGLAKLPALPSKEAPHE